MHALTSYTSSNNLKLLVVEDHPIFFEGLSFILNQLAPVVDIDCVNNVVNAKQKLLANSDYDLILLDLGLPDQGGLSLISFIKNQHILIPVSILSASENINDIDISLACGASGFISKSSGSEEILKAIKSILVGKTYLPRFYTPQENLSLTPRQKEVLLLLAEGLPNKRICQQLNLSDHTVKSHLKSLFTLFDVHNRTECTRKAIALGLL